MKQCLIRQPAGVGDIFFCQKIAKKIVEKYNIDVVWPVIPEFEWLKGCLNANRISYVSLTSDYKGKELYNSSCNTITDTDDLLYVPLQYADQHMFHHSAMVCKYNLVSLSHTDWAEFLNFNRNVKREDKLFYDILGLTDEDKYVLVNKNYGSPPGNVECPYIKINTDLKIVCMDFIDDITLLDWCKVLEHAVQIHTAETSLNYIIEKLPNCTGLNMYSKHAPPSYSQIKGLFRDDWICHV